MGFNYLKGLTEASEPGKSDPCFPQRLALWDKVLMQTGILDSQRVNSWHPYNQSDNKSSWCLIRCHIALYKSFNSDSLS